MFFTEIEPRPMSLRLEKKVNIVNIENGSHRPEHDTRVKKEILHCYTALIKTDMLLLKHHSIYLMCISDVYI